MEKDTGTYIIRKGYSRYRLVPFDTEKGKVLYLDIVVRVRPEPPKSITIDFATTAREDKAEFDTYLIIRGRLSRVPPHVLN